MTILATVGAGLGLLVLVLMSLAPAIVELDGRYPVARREPGRPTRAPHAARAVKTSRPATGVATGTRITAHV